MGSAIWGFIGPAVAVIAVSPLFMSVSWFLELYWTSSCSYYGMSAVHVCFLGLWCGARKSFPDVVHFLTTDPQWSDKKVRLIEE